MAKGEVEKTPEPPLYIYIYPTKELIELNKFVVRTASSKCTNQSETEWEVKFILKIYVKCMGIFFN